MVNKIVTIKWLKISENFKLKNLSVSHHITPSDFYTLAWQRGVSPIPLLVIRSLALLLSVAILTWSVYEDCNQYWLLFLTHWGLVLFTSMFLNAVVVSIAATCKKIPEGVALPWYVSSYWFLHNIAVPTSLLITALYWVLLYNPETLVVLGIMTHGLNAILVMTELLLSRTPVKILHIYQPLGTCILYGIFTAIYYLAKGTDGKGNPYIYEVLDWRNGGQVAKILAIAVVALIVIYCVVYCIAFIRDLLIKALIRPTTVKPSMKAGIV